MKCFTVMMLNLVFTITASLSFADEIIVEGGGAATSEIFMPMAEQYEKTTGDNLKIIYSSAADGLISLEKGKADILASITPLQDILIDAAGKGIKVDPKTLVSTQIGASQVVVFIHSYNNIKELSKQQLKDIFTGRIINWQSVGGDDEQISVAWEQGNSGVKKLFTHEILEGESVKANTVPAKNYYDIRDIVSRTSGAIGVAPFGLHNANVNMPKVPKMTSPIVVVTKGNPSAKVKRLLDFYKTEYSFLDQ
jgi:phosphate transport system substrate-binding protein